MQVQALRQKYMDACLCGDTDIIIYMIKTEDLNVRNKKFIMECLNYACKGDHIDVCKIIFGHRNPREQFLPGEIYYIIRDACRYGNLRIYQFYQKYNNSSPPELFREACESGNILLVKYLYKNNANIILLSSSWRWNDYLLCACKSGNIEIVYYILGNNILNEYDGYRDWNNGLCSACGCNGDNLYIVKFMIKKGGVTCDNCLKNACFVGNVKIIIFLTKRGVINWNAGLYEACKGGHIEIVKYMIEKGATNLEESMCIACREDHMEIVKFFISKGVNNWDHYLGCAAGKGRIEIVKFLILQGAVSLDQCLGCACFCGDIDFAMTMIEKGASNWNLGLLKACWKGHLNLVQLMLHYGATNLNEGLFHNLTKNTNISILLINKGANNLEYLKDTRDFRLLYEYNKFAVNDKKNYMDLLPEYPPCVLFVGSRLTRLSKTAIKRLPVELFKMLVQCC